MKAKQRAVYNTKEVAELLGISTHAVCCLCKQEAFPAMKAGKGYIINKKGFEKWLEEGFTK